MNLKALLVFCFISSIAHADKVAVLPVSYWLIWENLESPEKGMAVFQVVVDTLKEEGYEPLVGDHVNSAAATISQGMASDCRDSVCLHLVKDRLEVENVVFVSIMEEGLMYNVEVNLAVGDQVYGPVGGNFNKLKNGLKIMLQSAIRRAAPNGKTGVVSQSIDEESKQKSLNTQRNIDNGRQKPLGLAPFAVTAGITGLLAISGGVMESIGYLKYVDKDGDKGTEGEARALQTASRVVWGTAVVGAIGTVMLAFFTDFKKKRKEKKGDVSKARLRTSFGVMDGSAAGIFLVGGTF